jgi:hypothetical protein
LTEKQDPPVILSEWYTSDNANGKPNYAYIVFSKPINVMAWFNGGKVKFESGTEVSVTSTNINDLFFRMGNDTLRIDLTKAYPESQKKVRTAATMSFRLTYGEGAKDMWDDAGINGSANDRAAPVLAEAVTLKVGADNAKDTLVVIYSEPINEASMGVEVPVEIILSNGNKCRYITLSNPRGATDGNYYRVTYLVESDLAERCERYPAEGDSVRIVVHDEDSKKITDGFSNRQDSLDNLRQPLKVPQKLKWELTFKKNPFESGGDKNLGVVLSPGAKGIKLKKIDARILVFDNLGALAVDTLVSVKDSSKVNWNWDGTNNKGRMVGSGIYLFKASCTAEPEGKADGLEGRSFSARGTIGVVRGKK